MTTARKRQEVCPINQKELGHRLGVSQMTISRVLNNRPGVGPKLKRKLLEKMRSLGYVPDQVARGLRGKATHVIGLIIPDVSNSFFPEITRSIETEARNEEYRVLLAHTNESYEQECREIQLLRGFRVDGLIIAPAGTQTDIDMYPRLEKLKIPFVFIDRIKKDVSCSYVITDVERGALDLGRYLVKKGYRQWGYLRGPQGVSTSEAHCTGLRRSLEEAGMNPDRLRVVQAGFSEEEGYTAAGKLLEKGVPDVIIGMNDPVAVGAYRVLKEKRINVPREVGLVGFSDLKWSGLFEVPLTTVREPTAEIGRRALHILLEEIANPGLEKRTLTLQPKLIIRKSA